MSEANATALQPKKKKNPSSGSYKRWLHILLFCRIFWDS